MGVRELVGEGRWEQVADLLVEQGLFGVGVIDLAGCIAATNEALSRITGYGRDELVGRSVLELAHEGDRAEIEQALQRIAAGDLERYTAQLRGRARDGRALWTNATVLPLHDDAGHVTAALGVVEDVTEAVHAIERSGLVQERIREGLLAMTDAREPKRVLQAVVDLAREVVGARYAALGVVREGGRDLSDFLVSGIDREAAEAIATWPTGDGLLGAVTTSERPIRIADLGRHPDSRGFPPNHPPMRSFIGVPISYKGRALGNLYLAEKTGAPEFTSEDEVLLLAFAAQAAVVVENARMHERGRQLIEQLERTNKELERASQERSVFLASMSHELRTPLHALLLAADILRDPMFPVSEERTQELSETIATSGRHLLGLIDDLLELSRIEAGRFSIRTQPISLGLLLRESRQATAPLASKGQIRLDVPEAEDVWVGVDPLRTRQAIINLLANAVKFTEEGGRVWVEVHPSDDAVTIAVCDTGKGIAAEDLQRIFLPFERIGDARGAGLGLAISRSIAKAHGGTLEVRSEPGEGSRFELTLPRSQPVLHQVPSVPRHLHPAGTKVLVVEDDPRALELTIELLGNVGYVATAASTIAEALAVVQRTRPDLVLLDVKLGTEDGLDIVRQLRGDPATRDIPVIASSASASDLDIDRAKRAGCISFLAKPLTPESLIEGIAAGLGSSMRR